MIFHTCSSPQGIWSTTTLKKVITKVWCSVARMGVCLKLCVFCPLCLHVCFPSRAWFSELGGGYQLA